MHSEFGPPLLYDGRDHYYVYAERIWDLNSEEYEFPRVFRVKSNIKKTRGYETLPLWDQDLSSGISGVMSPRVHKWTIIQDVRFKT